MYKISVPIITTEIERQGREGILHQLKAMDAERVFLCVDSYIQNSVEKQKTLEALKRETEFFHRLGYEVGVWMWTFELREKHPFTPVYQVCEEEKLFREIACAADEEFARYAASYVAELASCGVDLIMFDDDYRYGCLGGNAVGCLCPIHEKKINERVGEALSRRQLAQKILTGKKNKYRDAWIDANREAFLSFAKTVRAAVDRVNPAIRLGACACLSSWDLDGTDAYELAKTLAGNTKPFVRLSGAAYWASRGSWGCRIGDVIEQCRMELSWTRQGDIEIFGEGDVFPRPRTVCPAAYLEGLDTALRADQRADGLLKYGIDYVSTSDYEEGYTERHQRNKPLYEGIAHLFGDKHAVGIRVYEAPKKVAYMDLGELPAEQTKLYYSFFSAAARSFAATSIATTYEGEGVCGACFGESAWSLPRSAAQKGLILDGVAAMILQERGIDVGIREVGKHYAATLETFADGQQIFASAALFDHVFSHAIQVESFSVCKGEVESKRIPMSYTYENAEGERFLVLNFDTRIVNKEQNLPSIRHYARSRQYAEAVRWLSRGESLPAYAYGNPDLYIMAKKNEDGAMSVGLWNFSVDDIPEPKIELDGAYGSIQFLHTEGTMLGNTVTLCPLPPFGFAAFEVK